MEEDKPKRKSFRERFLRLKVLLIVFIALVVLGVVGMAGVEKASDNPKFCTLCHNMQPYYDSFKNSDLLANKHAAKGVKCHGCHEASIKVQADEGVKYITGNYKTPLDKREFPKEFCLKCHKKDFESVKTKTKFGDFNPHDSKHGDLNCTTCHSSHRPSKVLCSNCHTIDQLKDLPSYWKTK